MTTTLDLGSLAAAAADYRAAVARLESATHDAESTWQLLPAALDSPATQVAVGRYVGPAHSLSTGLLSAADALHAVLSSDIQTLRYLQSQAAAQPDDPSWGTRAEATVESVVASITAITGGEAGSVELPCPAPPARQGAFAVHRATTIAPPFGPAVPSVPEFTELINGARALSSAIGSALETAGAAVVDGAGAAAAGIGAAVAGVLGTGALVLSLGGSTDTASQDRARASQAKTHDQSNRIPRAGIDPVRITPYTPCNPEDHGPGCQLRHMRVEKPGDEPFTGDKVRGDEEPGEMPGTKPNWTREESWDKNGWVYKDPESGVSQRVMRNGADARYPNGYVQFTNKNGQVIDINGRTVPRTSDAAHIPRNPDGSFPIVKGRWK